MPIFISYRRGQITDLAGRVNDSLREAFPDEEVFYDVERVPAGVDYHRFIDNWVERSDIFIALIGSDWNEQNRLDGPGDFVRIELEAALERRKPIIPVMVGGAPNLIEGELPETLRPLARRHAIALHSDRFRFDMGQMTDAVQYHLRTAAPTPERTETTEGEGSAETASKTVKLSRTKWLAIVVVAILSIACTYELSRRAMLVPELKEQLLVLESERSRSEAKLAVLAREKDTLLVAAESVSQDAQEATIAIERAQSRAADVEGRLGEAKRVAEETASQLNDLRKASGERIQTLRTYLASGWFRDPLRIGGRGPRMVLIPQGLFRMGSPDHEDGRRVDEGPTRQVSLPDFAMSQTEVTFADYEVFANATGRPVPDDRQWGRANRPVINVSWHDATAYVQWLSEQTDQEYRLPSESEWEFAARGGALGPYWWGEQVGKNNANCIACGSNWDGQQTAPVGSFPPNGFGLRDVLGNVWEWTKDCWHPDYVSAPADAAAWTTEVDGNCTLRVARGGGWLNQPLSLRLAERMKYARDNVASDIGFRVARTVKE
ncbi:MAG: SUMF1/EgtB/PvdO family nonheme iron enzyme [Pseudomonadota bacterium]